MYFFPKKIVHTPDDWGNIVEIKKFNLYHELEGIRIVICKKIIRLIRP